jgi:hypothetical protein
MASFETSMALNVAAEQFHRGHSRNQLHGKSSLVEMLRNNSHTFVVDERSYRVTNLLFIIAQQ